jgi:hypothetical protein
MNIKVQPTIQPETLEWYKTKFKKSTGAMGDVLESVARFGDKHPSASFFESPLDCIDHALTTHRAMMQQGRRLLKGVFTDGELTCCISVMNATGLTHTHPGGTLHAGIDDVLDYELPVQIDLNQLRKKIADLGIFERSYLELWAWGFWYSPGFDDREIETYIKQLA